MRELICYSVLEKNVQHTMRAYANDGTPLWKEMTGMRLLKEALIFGAALIVLVLPGGGADDLR